MNAIKRQIADGLATDTSRKLRSGVDKLPGQQRQTTTNKAEQGKIEKTIQDRKLSTFKKGSN
jgi:hypothetical protein